VEGKMNLYFETRFQLTCAIYFPDNATIVILWFTCQHSQKLCTTLQKGMICSPQQIFNLS